jgi:hypothetical protein
MAVTKIEDLCQKKRLTIDDLKDSCLWSELEPFFLAGITGPRQILFHAARQDKEIPTCFCGNRLHWNNDKRAYRKFCSKKCTAIGTADQAKITSLERYGATHYSKTYEFNQIIKETSVKKYGVEHYSKSKEFLDRVKETNLKKFGTPFATQSQTVKENTKKRFLEKYGVDNPMKCQAVRDNLFSNNMERTGVGNQAQRHYSEEARNLLADPEKFEELCNTHSISEIAGLYEISVTPLYSKVKQLGIKLPQLDQSRLEREVTAFVQSHYSGTVVLGDRTILQNREIDIWLPELSLAIEANGSFWHSENNGRTKNYHLKKTQGCNEKGIRLIHVWEHQWFQKPNIVKSMLRSVLGANQKIFARSCEIRELSTEAANRFLNENHLQGAASGSQRYGLYHKDELVSVMTFCRNRFGKIHQWELLRFANKINYNIVGGGSRLFARFVRTMDPESIVSYCDISVHSGQMYEKLGFTLTHHSAPNYKYTKDYQSFYSRNQFQKHLLERKLAIYNKSLSEWENMKLNGWDRIWDCGNQVYSWVR